MLFNFHQGKVGGEFSQEGGVWSLFQNLFDLTRTENGVAGFKTMFIDIERCFVSPWAEKSGWDKMSIYDAHSFFPEGIRYVWLIRRNRTRQAISFLKACQSEGWTARSEAGYKGKHQFSYRTIQEFEDMIDRNNAHWQQFFQHNQINPLVVVYEDFLKNPKLTLNRIFDFLEIEPPKSGFLFESEIFKPQSNFLNEYWFWKYKMRLLVSSVLKKMVFKGENCKGA